MSFIFPNIEDDIEVEERLKKSDFICEIHNITYHWYHCPCCELEEKNRKLEIENNRLAKRINEMNKSNMDLIIQRREKENAV